MQFTIQIRSREEKIMNDDCNICKDCLKPPADQCDSSGQPFKQPKKTTLKPRICFIITKKKNSSWIEDLCNREMMKPEDLVIYH